MTASSREAGVHADRSESLLPAQSGRRCNAQRKSAQKSKETAVDES
jgi:hypothetical protein